MPGTIVPTVPEDRAAIEEIIQENLGSFFNEAEVAVALELLESYMRHLENEREYFHLTARNRVGEIVGYASFGPIPLTQSSWDLYWIAVRRHQRRGGLGKRLVQAVEAEAERQGGTAVYVDTSGREGYTATRHFYESLGYAVMARFEDFYQPGDDKFVYRKWLSDRPAAPPPENG